MITRITLRAITWSTLASLTLFACSCSISGSTPPVTARAKPKLYEWHDDGGPGKVSVQIDLAEQIATYRRGGRPIGWSYVSTGKAGYATCPGNYRVIEKMPLKHSNRYGCIADAAGNLTNSDAQPSTPVPPGNRYIPAAMPYWMRITGYGVGMHGGDIPRPGEAVSHGCIRLPRDFVPELYQVTQIGTPVRVIRGVRSAPVLGATSETPAGETSTLSGLVGY